MPGTQNTSKLAQVRQPIIQCHAERKSLHSLQSLLLLSMLLLLLSMLVLPVVVGGGDGGSNSTGVVMLMTDDQCQQQDDRPVRWPLKAAGVWTAPSCAGS